MKGTFTPTYRLKVSFMPGGFEEGEPSVEPIHGPWVIPTRLGKRPLTPIRGGSTGTFKQADLLMKVPSTPNRGT
jgi:hypothetical protein